MTTIDATAVADDVDERPSWTAPTSRSTYVATLLLLLALLLGRLPAVLDELERTMPASLRSDIGDPSLVRLSLGVGAMLGTLVTLLALAVFWLLARSLERHLFDASVGTPRWRVGLFTLAVSSCFLVANLVPVVVSRTTLGPLTAQALTVAAGLGAAAVFAGRLRLVSGQRAAMLVTVTVALAWLTALASVAG